MEEPRKDKPLHGPERRTAGPLIVVVVVLAAVVALFVLISIITRTT